MNVSIIVGLKNNLKYSQYFYQTFRKLYPDTEICLVSYGSTDDTHKWLKQIATKDSNVKIYYSHENASLATTYNKAVSLSTNKYVVFLHNDMIVGPKFLENIHKHLNDNSVVSYTVVEPPIFNNTSVGKVLNNFGDNVGNIDTNKFYEFCESYQHEYLDQVEAGCSFFMALSKETFEKVGGFDTLFYPMFAEDIDLIWRLEANNLKPITSKDALSYHFVSKTSRFSDEFINTSSEIEYRSNRNFIRKWGSTLKGPKYSTSIAINNCNDQILELIEPWCNNIYIHKNLSNLYVDYLKEEQKNTKINLRNKIHFFENIDNILTNDSVLILCDANKINENNFGLLARLPTMIKNNNQTGTFKLDIYTIMVKNLIECRSHVV